MQLHFCAFDRHSRFTGDFDLQNSGAKVHAFATTFATAGSTVMNIGYARVSTLEQNLDLQLQALKKGRTARRFSARRSPAQVGSDRSFSGC